MTDNEAQKAGIEPEPRKLHFRIDNGKANMQPPANKAEWRKLLSVGLENATPEDPEDWVGVATKWEMPSPFDGVSTADLYRVKNMIRVGDYRASPQSPNWVGHVVAEVLGLNIEAKAARAKISDVLKVWFANKALIKVLRKDDRRRDKVFVIPGPGPDSDEGENEGAPV